MKQTEQTLLDQLHIGDVEIADRKALFGIDAETIARLQYCKTMFTQYIDQVVDEFYDVLTSIDDNTVLIGDADTLARLRTAQQRYILELFSGIYDAQYVNNRLRIGLVHKRIGVTPKLYLSAVKTLKDTLIRILRRHEGDIAKVFSVIEAIDRILYFDTSLVFDTYIRSLVSEIEIEKHRTEVYARGLEYKVEERTRELEMLAKKDPLTDLFNVRAMNDLLHKELARAQRSGDVISLVYFDVDHFKQINDTFGHERGDTVLIGIGQILTRCCRAGDYAFRCGGDEFCVLVMGDAGGAEEFCQRLLKEFSLMFPEHSLSIGIAETGPVDFVDVAELLKMADARMYKAKGQDGSFIVK